MSIAKRLPVALTSVVTVVIALTVKSSGQIMVNQPSGEEQVWQGEKLKRVFAGIGDVVVLPVGVEEIEGAGFGLNFYVGWGGAAPRTYSHVSQVVEQFRGRMTWSIRPEFNNYGAFISALPIEQARRSFQGQNVERVSLSDLHDEVNRFCDFTRQSLQNAKPSPNHTQERETNVEPFEDSEYRVLLVAQPDNFSGSPTSKFDRMLHFGVTKDEWLVLSREEENLSSLPNREASFLLKLKQRYEIVRLSPNDVVSLSNELVTTESNTTDTRLQGAIRKLLRILVEASGMKLGVVFEPND